MYKWSALALPITLIVWVFTNLCFIQYHQDSFREFQERKLDLIVNYAVDAAVDEMVEESRDLKLDYGDFEYLSCNPETALDTFIEFFGTGYGLSGNIQTRQLITSTYLPCFIVACYDGYYVARPTKINSSGAYDAVFSMKKPYLAYKESNPNIVYALNLGLQDCKKYNGMSVTKVFGINRSDGGSSPLWTEAEQKNVINSLVSDEFMKTVYDEQYSRLVSSIYIPKEMTDIARVNPIDDTTVLAYVANVPGGFGRYIETFGIGGARIDHEKFCACYERSGVKYYQYISLLDLRETINPSNGRIVRTYKHPKTHEICEIIEVFENPMLAAQHGYKYDLSFIQ